MPHMQGYPSGTEKRGRCIWRHPVRASAYASGARRTGTGENVEESAEPRSDALLHTCVECGLVSYDGTADGVSYWSDGMGGLICYCGPAQDGSSAGRQIETVQALIPAASNQGS
jgi:hypothetical protein